MGQTNPKQHWRQDVKESDRAERNLRIVLARMREVPVKALAEQYGISERQIRHIMAD